MAGNVVTANPLAVGGNEVAVTYNGIDALAYREYQLINQFANQAILRKNTPLMPGERGRTFKLRGDLINSGGYHDRGVAIQGGTMVQTTKTIEVERPRVEAADIDYWDTDISRHPEVPYAIQETVRKQTERLNELIARVMILGARQASVTNVHGGGHVVTRVAANVATAYPLSSTGANNLESDIGELAQKFDERNVARTGRVLFMRPREVNVLMESTRLVNRDYVDVSIGSLASQVVTQIRGFSIIMTNYLPSTNITNDLTKYNGDFTVATRQPIAVGAHINPASPPLGIVSPSSMMRSGVFKMEREDTMFVKNVMTYGIDWIAPWQLAEIGVSSS